MYPQTVHCRILLAFELYPHEITLYIFQLHIVFLTFTQVGVFAVIHLFSLMYSFLLLEYITIYSFLPPMDVCFVSNFLVITNEVTVKCWNESPDAPAQEALEVELLDYGVCATLQDSGRLFSQVPLPVFAPSSSVGELRQDRNLPAFFTFLKVVCIKW